jgi:hypothetical protein
MTRCIAFRQGDDVGHGRRTAKAATAKGPKDSAIGISDIVALTSAFTAESSTHDSLSH